MATGLTFRPMRAEDLELVRLWLGQPHVARWYLAGSTIERELDELRQSVAGEQPTHALVVLARGRPIGWCQWYLCSDYPDHAVGVGAEPGDIGLDYAIGDPARVGKGVGTRLIAALIAHIRERQPASGLIADPQASNIPSRRVLEKNGFRLVREGAVESERTPATMAIYRLRPPELEPRALGLQEKARAFCAASVRDSTGRAVRMLSETPELAEAGFATAVVLGDRSRVRAELERDPGLARRVDPESGWTALHLVSGSRWHWLQPERTNGLVAAARLLLGAGADLHARSPRTGGRTPLGCATASASAGEANEPLIAMLLDHGAVPDDGDLYMVGFARNASSALRLLLEHMPDLAGSAWMALATPIGKGDTASVRVLLEAGADPRGSRGDPR
jgi:aminoglycoside 6'-N-acetyltransferase